ncbi:MAG: hypothetical protein M1274_00815 [Actinobacteria bacterium]|nr:hypothetical protein [Actinomycetota bacterium]
MPIFPQVVHYFPTRIRGVPNKDAGYDNALRYRCMKDAVLEFGWDWAMANGVFPSEAFDALGVKQVRWPGGDLPADAPFQFVENEWLAEDEYDAFLADPNGFTLTSMLPRVAGNLEGLGQMPLPPLYWFSNAYNLIAIGGNVLAAPPMRTVLESLLNLADATAQNNAALGAYIAEMGALGYPYGHMSVTVPAFDMVSDFFRGLRGGSLDIYRNPEKLLAAVELMEQVSIAPAITAAKMSGNPRVFVPMHRGADNFMSEEAFERFYWPSFSRLIEALVAEGLTPMPLFEGGYNSRLKYLAQLPPGKVAAHFDHIDRKKFKEMCGEVMCFWGNVPASLLCTGTPQQVKDDVRELIELFGDTGTLMIDGNQGIPDEARPENVLAMREAVDEYGAL